MNSYQIKRTIDNSFIYLLRTRPFYGAMLSSFNMTLTHTIPTAGVGYDAKTQRLLLMISPDFWAKLTEDERIAVLTHECDHVLNKHIIDYGFLKNKQMANIAMDIHINQYIKNLPKDCMFFYNFEDSNGVQFKPNLSTVEYYNMLEKEECKYRKRPGDQTEDKQSEQSKDDKKNKEEKYDKIDQYGKYRSESIERVLSWDSHDWDNIPEEEKLKAISDLMKRSLDKVHNSYDSDSNKAKQLLDKILERFAELNYKKLLENAIKKSLPAKDREYTWFRPNKRHGYVAPGTRSKRIPKVDFYIDSSGSMSVREINFALATVDKFLTLIDKCNINLFHTEVYNSQKYKKGHKVKESEFETGGTDLTGVMQKIVRSQADLSIIITDGYYGDVEIKTDKKLLFLITKGGTVDHPLKRFGETIQLKEGK